MVSHPLQGEPPPRWQSGDDSVLWEAGRVPWEASWGSFVFTHYPICSARAWNPRLLLGEGVVTAVPSHSPPPIPEGQTPQGVLVLSKTHDDLPET